jgi:hypothetical protein
MSAKNGCPNPKCDDPECKLGKIMQSGSTESVKEKPRTVIGPLTAEELKEKEAIKAETKKVKDLVAKTEAAIARIESMRSAFWANIELKRKLSGESLHIENINGVQTLTMDKKE